MAETINNLWNWLFARKENGRFILRIDDTDLERSTKAYEDGVKRDLAWLGLNYDETVNQSSRFERYDAARDKLICEAIGPTLKARGLTFVGIDVIGDYMTEINVTSPTGIQEIDRFDGVSLESDIWDVIESRHASVHAA